MSNLPNANDPYKLVPELGDIVTFVSERHGTSTGKIVYRDDQRIRIHLYNGSTRPVEFTLDPESGQFTEDLGVSELVMHKKRRDPHFAIQLGTVPGEVLEFYDINGDLLFPDRVFTVAEIIATEDRDAIQLDDGRVIEFGFIGPPLKIGLILPHTPKEEEAFGVNNSANTIAEPAESLEVFPELDEMLLPASIVEEIPTDERVFTDTIQRVDMFTSLFMDIPEKRQKDPRVMQALYRISDVLLAMKNSVVVRDDAGAIQAGAIRSYIADTVETVLAKQPNNAPIAALMPVAAVNKVVYIDEPNEGRSVDVEIRSDVRSLVRAANAESAFTSSATGAIPFISYIYSLMRATDAYVPSIEGDARIRVDQDVLRSHLPTERVEGFPLDSIPKPAKQGRFGRSAAAAEETMIVKAYLGAIQDRTVRLIGPSRIYNTVTETEFTVAPADTAMTVGHVILSGELARRRAPTRSSVLLWDIQASELSRKAAQSFYSRLSATIEDQMMVTAAGETSLVDQLRERISSSGALQLMQRDMIGVLDTFGLQNLEITEPVFKVLRDAMAASQKAWADAYSVLKQAAVANIAKGAAYPVDPVSVESPLLSSAVLEDELLAPVADLIKERETLFKSYDLVYAYTLLQHANSTLGPYWYALAAENAAAANTAREIAASEIRRQERTRAVRLGLAAEFSARPTINPCKHVAELEKIRSIRSDDARMQLFDKFLKEYQAGQRNNFILCSQCGDHLVCKHEVLLLNEYANPGRSAALHKALLLEYGDGVFEGAYICKNCGQKIREIEYDTHVEFSDDGKPLVGRGVVQPDEGEDGVDEVVIEEEVEEMIPYKEGVERAIYFVARTLFERCGINASDEMFKRVVPACRQFIEERVTPEATYTAAREKEKAAIAAGKRGVQLRPEYKHYFAGMQLGAIGALVLLEFQTSNVAVPLPFKGIEFSREGFPLDGYTTDAAGVVDFAKAVTGALQYITFCLSSVTLDLAPWMDASWSALSNKKQRFMEARNALLSAMLILLGMKGPGNPNPLPLGTVTDMYKTRLETARAAKAAAAEGTSDAGLSSSGDRFPPVYRPLQRLPTDLVIGESRAVQNVQRFEENVQTKDVSIIGPVVFDRSHQLNQQIMGAFHSAAAANGIIVKNSPRSDSVCCFARVGAVRLRGMGVKSIGLAASQQAELELHAAAAQTIRARDPASSAAGAHIYLPWVAPFTSTVLPTPSPDDYYKLFLKNCFGGRNYGAPHELGPDYVCRNCHFEYPVQLLFPIGAELSDDMSAKAREARMAELAKQNKEIAIAALERFVTIDEPSFMKLEAQIRARNQIIPPPPILQTPFFTTLASMRTQLESALPDVVGDWDMLINALASIQDEDVQDNVGRRIKLDPFTKRYDAAIKKVNEALTHYATREDKATVKDALEGLSHITEDQNGNVGARNVMQALVVQAEQIASAFSNSDVNAEKWFGNVNRSHAKLLDAIWTTAAATVTRQLEEMRRVDDVARDAIQNALSRFARWLGAWMTTWIREFRAGTVVRDLELRLMLRWSCVVGLRALLTPSSVYYADVAGSEVRTVAVRFIAGWLIRGLATAGTRVAKYQLTAAQIEKELTVRAEKERTFFTTKMSAMDADVRKAELMKKKYKIGDWSVGTRKNLFTYDSTFYEFERAQRAAMGILDFDTNITGGGAGRESAAEAYGFVGGAGGEQIDVERDNLFYAPDGEEGTD